MSVKGKRVFVRADFNVPLDGGRITDDRRIRLTLPTIESIVNRGGTVILASHLGRPAGTGYEASESIEPVRLHLERLLNRPVRIAGPTPTHPQTAQTIRDAAAGEILLLENLRFEKGEKKGDPAFAATLAQYADIYCNDAFGACHRTDASMHALPIAMAGKPRVAGHLLLRELRYLQGILDAPKRPFIAILGGAKVSDKLLALRNLLTRVDAIIVGGAMAYTFLKAQGMAIGKSRVESDLVGEALLILNEAKAAKVPLHLPVDHVCGESLVESTPTRVCHGDIPDGWMGLDIGPDTVSAWQRVLSTAGTVVWNGPLGAFETTPFEVGTFTIARTVAALAQAGSIVVAGGGDTAAAVSLAGVDGQFSHVSTGGGASLELVEGKKFITLDALDEAPAVVTVGV